MKAVMITCNKMAVRLIFIMTYETISTTNLPQHWIERFAQVDVALMRWPPRSPDLTPCDFFLWGFVKDTVFVSPVHSNLQELRDRITAAVVLIDRDMLTRVWNELDYRLDVCYISQGRNIEHL